MPGRDGTGLHQCGQFLDWKDMPWEIVYTGDGGLVFVLRCPLCLEALREDPFAYPSDYELYV